MPAMNRFVDESLQATRKKVQVTLLLDPYRFTFVKTNETHTLYESMQHVGKIVLEAGDWCGFATGIVCVGNKDNLLRSDSAYDRWCAGCAMSALPPGHVTSPAEVVQGCDSVAHRRSRR